MINKLVAAVAILLCTTVSANDSVVKIGNGSGVIVSPSGLILTADHVSDQSNLDVMFSNGSRLKARLVYSPPRNGIDEAQVYQIVGEGQFPFSRIADGVPAVGSSTHGMGYSKNRLTFISGTLTNNSFDHDQSREFNNGLRGGVVTNSSSLDGMSGGPLFNENGEIIGLLSMSNELSYWIGLGSIKDSISRAVRPLNSQRLIMFAKPGDRDCEMYKRDILNSNYAVTVVSTDDPNFDQIHDEYKKFTGSSIQKYPTFWVESTAKSRAESYRPGFLGTILGWFRSIIGSIIHLIFGSPAPQPPPAYTGRDLPPIPLESPEALDSSNLTVIILAAKQDTGFAKGIATKALLNKAIGPLKRRINDSLGSRARVEIVAERLSPEKFLLIKSAAGVDANPGVIIVLVKAQSLGLKGLIASRIESAVSEKIPGGVPVDIVFERAHRDDYDSIYAAVQSLEGQGSPEITEQVTASEGSGLSDVIKSQLGDIVSDRIRGSENAIIKTVGEKLDDRKPVDDDNPPLDNGIIAAATLGLGYTGHQGMLAWLKSRAEKKARAFVVSKIKGSKE